MPELAPGQLYLGRSLDPVSGKPTGEPVLLDARDLTTHGVIVGMTGSGKTGLGVVMLEELLLSRVPTLVLDPKGDMGNLALVFPEFRGSDFLPWVNVGDAVRQGLAPEEHAAATASTWRDGLAESGMTPERIADLRDGVAATIYTPGSHAGVPLSVLGSLEAPALDWPTHGEALRDEIQGYVSGLLGLAGVESDPVSGREHILVATLIEQAWQNGENLDLAMLVARIQEPPLVKLGVLEVDDFFPEKDRRALALRLNGLLASPTFASWMAGPPVDVGAMLAPVDGRTRCAIVYLAHLSDAERQYVVTLVLSRAVTWMQGQSGTTDLRALVYMDEVFGFVPPTANPPAKKPIMTIMKQGRAFGLGMVLATQNPVDLDYKALSNAGSWFVGRLQTERDKARLAEGLASARGDVDVGDLEARVGALGKRQFLLHSVHRSRPEVFATRWAASYLRGPLTRDQVTELMRDAPERATTAGLVGGAAPRPGAAAASAPAAPAAAAPASEPATDAAPGARQATLAEDETRVAPDVADGIAVRYADPRAPWLASLSAGRGGPRLQAAILVRADVRFEDSRAGVLHIQEWRAAWLPVEEPPDARRAQETAWDDRDLAADAPNGAVYLLPSAPIDRATYFRRVEQAIEAEVFRSRRMTVFRHEALGLYSDVGESRELFAVRCESAARERAVQEDARCRARYGARLEKAARAVADAEARIAVLQADVAARRQQEMIGGASALFGALLGGRSLNGRLGRAARAMGGASSRRSMTTRVEERLRVAEEKAADARERQASLEGEMRAECDAIQARWDAAAREVEDYQIAPKKSAIAVAAPVLAWVPA